MKTVLITGANGFIARRLARELKDAGHRVIGVTTSNAPTTLYDRVALARLGHSLGSVLDGEHVDVVIHAAYYSGPDEFEVNVDGTQRWIEEAQERGATLQILLSSLSAHAPASDYALAKLELEGHIASVGGVALRLAVVVGNGGMFQRMKTSMAKTPLLPLLDAGNAPVYVLGVDFLAHVVSQCIEANGNGLRGRPWHLHQPTAYRLRDILNTIRERYHYKCTFMPIPSLPILWTVLLFEKLGMNLPVTSANIRGLRQGRHTTPHTDFGRFGRPEESLDRLIAVAAAEERSPDSDGE